MHFFKTLILVFLASIGLNAFAEDACKEKLEAHIELVNENELYLEKIGTESKTIGSFEIIRFQKSLTARYASLNALLKLYSDEAANCWPAILGKAAAIHDFTRIGQSVIANNDLRRITISFTKYPKYNLVNFIDDYKKFTSKEMINSVQAQIDMTVGPLPYEQKFQLPNKDYDPNLYAISDIAINAATSTVAGTAKIWGFVSDHLQWRQGRLKNKSEARSLALKNLSPLDLIYEKRSFVLSNYTIPGYWGHVGIWLGTKAELMLLGIWDKEFFAPFRAQVEAGNNIVEIRKQGLNFQSLDSFLNLDEFAITRMNGVDLRVAQIIEELSLQVDKKYDFKFDARTADVITCTELISFSYGDFKWHETKTLFQISLRPDDIAVTTLGANPQAEFILYLKGSKKNGPVQNLPSDKWKVLFSLETAEEKAEAKRLKKEKQNRERLEREAFDRLYGHG